MAAKIRYYLDENVPVAVAAQLHNRGIDAVTVRDLRLFGDSDSNHLQRAADMQRVLCMLTTWSWLRLVSLMRASSLANNTNMTSEIGYSFLSS